MSKTVTNVKGYTTKQLLDKIKSLSSYRQIPSNYWILGVQSDEDEFNKFDDKFYLFKGKQHIATTTGTTNAGLTGLKNYDAYTKEGCAVIKTNEWYYDLWIPGYHKGKMKALTQNKPIKYYRDWNKNNKVEEIGTLKQGIIGINFHTATYRLTPQETLLIDGWSTGCQVLNNNTEYYKWLDLIGKQSTISYCLIKEF